MVITQLDSIKSCDTTLFTNLCKIKTCFMNLPQFSKNVLMGSICVDLCHMTDHWSRYNPDEGKPVRKVVSM